MAKKISWEGTITDVQPINGTDFSIDELRATVGGYIELLRLTDGRLLIFNEEGKLLRLDYNHVATEFAHVQGLIAPADFIVGNVLLCDAKEVK